MKIGSDFLESVSSSRMSRREVSGSFMDNQDGDHLCGIRALWQGVITQALMDAGSNSKKLEMRKIKARAISWLNGDSEDFIEVCEMAGREPSDVRKKAKAAIKNGCKWRVETNPFIKTAEPDEY